MIHLCVSAFQTIKAETACHTRVETGGILIGYETSSGVVIVNATGPGPKARRYREAVELDLTFIRQQSVAANARGLQYQGSWHSHPTKNVSAPSPTDLGLLQRTAGSENYRLNTAIMIIANQRPRGIDDLVALACERGNNRIRTSEIILCKDHPVFPQQAEEVEA